MKHRGGMESDASRVAFVTVVLATVSVVTLGLTRGSIAESAGHQQTLTAPGKNQFLSTTGQFVSRAAAPRTLVLRAGRAEWIVAPLVFGTAAQNVPLTNAWSELRDVGIEVSSTGSTPTSWSRAEHELRVLISIPETDVTPKQRRFARSAEHYLDLFFHSPGLWGSGT